MAEPVPVRDEVAKVMLMRKNPSGGRVDAVPQPQLALPLNVKQDGEIRLYRMTLPFLPPSKNVYDNWLGTWKSGCKAKWVRHIQDEIEAQMMPKGLTRIGLAATLIFPTKQRRDPQNYSNCLWNFVPDALVRGGVLVDDRDGAIDIGSNWGIKMAVDTRTGIPTKRRQRTILSITMRVPS